MNHKFTTIHANQIAIHTLNPGREFIRLRKYQATLHVQGNVLQKRKEQLEKELMEISSNINKTKEGYNQIDYICYFLLRRMEKTLIQQIPNIKITMRELETLIQEINDECNTI